MSVDSNVNISLYRICNSSFYIQIIHIVKVNNKRLNMKIVYTKQHDGGFGLLQNHSQIKITIKMFIITNVHHYTKTEHFSL